MKINYKSFNLELVRRVNQEFNGGLKILGWMRSYDETSNVITAMNPETRDLGILSLTEGVKYSVIHREPVIYLFPEENHLIEYNVVRVEGTLSLEHFFAGPELIEAKFVVIDRNRKHKRNFEVKRTFLAMCLGDRVKVLDNEGFFNYLLRI